MITFPLSDSRGFSLLSFFLRYHYLSYQDRGWILLGKAPFTFNIAFPDFGVEYLIASFSGRRGEGGSSSVVVEGRLPRSMYENDGFPSFVSLTVYDLHGEVISSVHLRDPFFRVDVERDLLSQDERGKEKEKVEGDPYLLIYRMYHPLPHSYEYPTIYVNRKALPSPAESLSMLIDRSSRVSRIFSRLFSLLSLVKKPSVSPSSPSSNSKEMLFFYPSLAPRKGLFVNPHAYYLVAFPPSSSPSSSSSSFSSFFVNLWEQWRQGRRDPRTHLRSMVLIINGQLPPPSSSSIWYIGFMACNYRSTETDDSIGWHSLRSSFSRNQDNDGEEEKDRGDGKERGGGGHYRIFVAFSVTEALRHGYQPARQTHHLLLWNPSNQYPIVVYREVNTDRDIRQIGGGGGGGGRGTITSDILWTEEKMRSPYYPTIEYAAS